MAKSKIKNKNKKQRKLVLGLLLVFGSLEGGTADKRRKRKIVGIGREVNTEKKKRDI